MRSSSSSPSQPSSASELHPVLQAALDSLDVELEEELTRYRRQRYLQTRHGKHIPSWQPVSSTETKQGRTRSPQLPLTQPLTEPFPPLSIDPSFDPPLRQTEEQASANLPIDQTASEKPASEKAAKPSSAPALHHLLSKPSPGSVPADTTAFDPMTSSAANLGAANLAIVAALQSTHSAQSTSDKTLDRLRELTLTSVSSDEWADYAVDQTHNSWSNEGIDRPAEATLDSDLYADLPLSDFSTAPDDYLESTEELLNSIAEEMPNFRAERESSLLDSLLTPLGIGSMLLLLLSSATLGYVIMHPSSLDVFTAKDNASQGNAANSGKNNAASEPFASPLIPDSPNLAAEEFVDLNVNNLSTIPNTASSQGRSPVSAASPGTQPSAGSPSSLSIDSAPTGSTPAPTNTSPPIVESSSAASIPEPVAVADPEPVNPEPVSPEPETPPLDPPTFPSVDASVSETAETSPEALPETSPEPLPETSPETTPPEIATAPATPSSVSGTYYVVTPYSGDPSLEQARQVVPEAYVRNFETGASVQLGVFSDAENAQELIQELQGQGIPAEIYQP